MADAPQYLIGTNHLRDRLRRHEGADLDGVQTRTDQCLDESDPIRDPDRGVLVLKAVARPNLDDADAVAHQEAAGCTSASSAPSPTISPTLHLIFFSTPA